MTGKQIRRIRDAMGLTQVDFGERIGLAGNSVARIERGVMIVTKTVAILVGYVAREAGVADSATHTGGTRQVAPPKSEKSSRATDPKGTGRKSKSTVQRKRR
jgi:transcriptional regulator with XRE-family HTH domain